MAAITTSTLSPDYQVTIPKEFADRLSWKPGQKLALLPKDNGVILVAVPELEELFGIARGVNVEDYRDRNDRY